MMNLEYKPYLLDFKFEAGTSRGVLHDHSIYLIKIVDEANPQVYGMGEAAPLQRLSPETAEEVGERLRALQQEIRKIPVPGSTGEVYELAYSLAGYYLPSLRFALETALLDLLNGGKRIIFDNAFYKGQRRIPINGLVWMGEKQFMKDQIDAKLAAGFTCIKMKVGALDMDTECELLAYMRERSKDLMIRVDANGAFSAREVLARLKTLSAFGIHSVEQPIMPGQYEAMQQVCRRSPIPVALDEELVGVNERSHKQELLKFIRPQYIILKPTLLGGFQSAMEWITIAEQLGVGWWVTSALESNVGLNAICQFTAGFDNLSYQGLGTGQLYHNNFRSPLEVSEACIHSGGSSDWDILI